MRRIPHLSYLLFVTLILTSCVSKKKYLEMVDAKEKFEEEANRANAENASLKSDLTQAEKDFKLMKDFMFGADAKKNDELAKVEQQLQVVEDSYNLLQEDLNKTKNLFKDQRYFNAKASSEIARLEIEVKQMARDTASLNYSLKLLQQRADEYKNSAQQRAEQVNSKNLEISSLKGSVEERESSIAQLEQDIKTQQDKINAINDAFINLRKQLVIAKSDNKPLDPNSNQNVDKISKNLGHY